MLSILGIVAVVVLAIQIYKTAAGNGRNAPLWTFISVVIGIGLQFVVPMLAGIVLAVYLLITGTPQENLESAMFGMLTVISILGIVLSIAGMAVVAKYVARIKDDEPAASVPPPPPPPTFGDNQ